MSSIADHRARKDEFFLRSPQSPIDDPGSFTGLSYYDEVSALSFRVPMTPGDGAEVTVQTSDGRERIYHRAGTIALEIEGEQVDLTLYRTPHNDGYFVPFRDATSGNETYGAGRFLDLEEAVDGIVAIDFNLAYNPYCAYSEGYSCPLPPPENWLPVPVRAGERGYA